VRRPLLALAPVQPGPPAAHEAALLLDQFSVTHQPDEIDPGDAVRLTVGAGAVAVTVTLVLAEVVPPIPVQVRV